MMWSCKCYQQVRSQSKAHLEFRLYRVVDNYTVMERKKDVALQHILLYVIRDEQISDDKFLKWLHHTVQ